MIEIVQIDKICFIIELHGKALEFVCGSTQDALDAALSYAMKYSTSVGLPIRVDL